MRVSDKNKWHFNVSVKWLTPDLLLFFRKLQCFLGEKLQTLVVVRLFQH